MAFIAIAVPVVIVTIASVTYFSLGVDAQYESLYAQAEEMAIQAINQSDLPQKRAELEAALRMLDQVETYRSDTPEVRTLQAELRSILDDLDLVVRVDYQPAIVDGLSQSANITQIVISGFDLYLLDANNGNVIRAELIGDLYYNDPNFQCGPNSAGGVGPLVKIAPWSPGFQPEADVIAIDSSGKILYCSENELPLVEQLAPPPADNWGNITTSSLDFGDYYVLDVPSNGIWIYSRSIFSEAPNLFFNADVPQLDDVIDMTVNRDDLYLLHEDGSLTLCVHEALDGVPTRCSDVAYVDFRPGSENLPLIPASPFTQILYTQPPDPSLFFLEPQKHAIYHFSLRNLAFQRQYLPVEPLSNDEATAFTVDTVQRNLFLVIGNQVFHGIIP
jgi:hypothetical protein